MAIAVTLLITYARRPFASASSMYKYASPQESTRGEVEAELLVLRSDGFQPREIKRPQGKFLLAIQNQSGEEEPAFILRREDGESIRQVRVSKRQSKYRELVNLPPGRYVLAEANHSDWMCRIIIEQ